MKIISDKSGIKYRTTSWVLKIFIETHRITLNVKIGKNSRKQRIDKRINFQKINIVIYVDIIPHK